MITQYYSQNGEDFLLDQMFDRKNHGFFVEVGCIDGRRFSNTLTFEERGWRGMCIEPHGDYIDLLKTNRPRSIICHCAAGATDLKNVTFYANARGSLSTLDKTKESEFRSKYHQYFSGFEEQTIEQRSLDSLIHEHKIEYIDILSIDVEGSEYQVIQGLDFQVLKPSVIVVEVANETEEKKLDRILLKHEYSKSIKLANNLFYVAELDLSKKILNKTYQIDLLHTRHPLDLGEDAHVHKAINTAERNRFSHYIKALVRRNL